MTDRSVSSTATMEGSRRTTPSPRTNTRAVAGPRSIARARESARKNITGSVHRVAGPRGQPEEISARRAPRDQAVVARTASRNWSPVNGLYRRHAPALRSALSASGPTGPAGMKMKRPRAARAPGAPRLVAGGHRKRRAASGLEVLEQDLLHCLIVLHDEDPLAVEPHGLINAWRDRTGGARARRPL